jgi:CII-binding regulator of phage lambda lysogenization HflD
MKKIIAIGVLMVVMNGAFAQDAISKFFSKYQADESFSSVTVSSKMFGLFTNMEADTPEDKEVLEAISKLKGLKILAKQEARNARELYKEAFVLIPIKEYEELMSVRNEDKDMKFYIKESGGKISELLMIMGGNEQFMVMSLFGEIDLKQISRIGKKMDVKGLEHLEKMGDHQKKH